MTRVSGRSASPDNSLCVKRKTEMKDSVLKIAALALLIVVFAAVVITARWTDDSACSHVNQPTRITCEIATKSGPTQSQTSHLNTQADAGDNWAKIRPVDTQGDHLGSNVDDPEHRQNRSAKKLASRPEEEPDEGAEPPDNSKDTYGKDDVE